MSREAYSPPAADASARARLTITALADAARVGEDDAIEAVYRHFHELIERDDGSEVMDHVLRSLNVELHHESVLLSILTITALAHVRDRLSCRPDFYQRVADCLAARQGPDAAAELLFGLE